MPARSDALQRVPAALPSKTATTCPRWVWALLGAWLTYSLGLLAWHVLQNPGLYDLCRTL